MLNIELALYWSVSGGFQYYSFMNYIFLYFNILLIFASSSYSGTKKLSQFSDEFSYINEYLEMKSNL